MNTNLIEPPNSKIDYEFLENLTSPSSISLELRRTLKQIWYLQMQQKKLSMTERKADTRQKIQMGGLIKKAGLEHLHKNNPEALYGLLKSAKNHLDTRPEILNKWAEIGSDLK